MPGPEEFKVQQLGPCRVPTREICQTTAENLFTSELERIPNGVSFHEGEAPAWGEAFEKAGMRQMLYFHPERVRAGIVTCGGICPGLNDVIRSLFMTLRHTYGVRHILGYRYGFRGLDPSFGLEPIKLEHDKMVEIHHLGGTMLGTARGRVDAETMIDTLKGHGVNMLFVIGGDGSQRGAHAIHRAARARGEELAVVGIPKTIDNDINYVTKTFGFDSAVSIAKMAVEAAHVEAQGNPGGIGLVKVMGRDSGFIAAHAALASMYVNVALVPEVPFALEGDQGLLAYLEHRLTRDPVHRRRAVLVVAEGAGQDLMRSEGERFDASGNKLHDDIGLFLKTRIASYLKEKGIEANLKYIDPSYMLRALPTNAADSIYAAELGRYAVHAAMAGKSDLMIGLRYDHYIHVPIPLATASRRKIDPQGGLWRAVVQATGQPDFGRF